jgi:GntR family transcriptional repressor for pyruvate dehydrogenase complex
VAPIDFFTIRDIFEARLPLERSIAALASQRATPQQVDELARLVDTMREYGEQDDISGLIRLDQRFHETLAGATGNRVMREIAEDLHNVCLRFWNLSSEARDHDYEGVEELAQVVAALRAADADLAARVMGVHVLAFLTIFDEASANMLQKLPLDEGDLRREK